MTKQDMIAREQKRLDANVIEREMLEKSNDRLEKMLEERYGDLAIHSIERSTISLSLPA